ncbi:MAG TPA: alpha/beta hydrolase [Candidatus Limnocylindrales bacterium]|nr:alpha/beta hydrolase [Candidatus Limnocylindrales bacterium]
MSRAFILALFGVLVICGCGSGGNAVVPSVAPATGTTRPSVTGPGVRLNEALTLGDGRKIAARCLGSGTPTVLLETGGSNDMNDWPRDFVDRLAARTTTCLYSRAGGTGSSAPAVRPPTMDSVTSDAVEVLELAKTKAGVEGPYIWVGWSLGGSVALAEALSRPDQTVGVAILDTDFPADFVRACLADGRSQDDCQAEFDDDIDAKFMETEIAQAVKPLDVPAVLVTAMTYPECFDSPSATLSANIAGTTVVAPDCATLAAAIADKQAADWPAAFPQIKQTRIQADHDGLVRSAGDQIADLILAILDDAEAPG